MNEEYELAFEFLNDDFFDRTYKILYFEKKDAEVFLDIFQQYINEIDLENPTNIININDENDNDHDDNEDEENEEEEDEKDNNEQNEEENGKALNNEENGINSDELNNNIKEEKDKNIEEIILSKDESKDSREVEVIN